MNMNNKNEAKERGMADGSRLEGGERVSVHVRRRKKRNERNGKRKEKTKEEEGERRRKRRRSVERAKWRQLDEGAISFAWTRITRRNADGNA